MLKRITLALAIGIALLGATLPSGAATKAKTKTKIVTYTYSKNYVGSMMGAVVFTFNPQRDFGNPNVVSNPYEDVSIVKGHWATSAVVDPAIDMLKGTPADTYYLKGTPADQNFLTGASAANQNVAGVSFRDFKGTPVRLKVTDSTGLPVPWVAAQCYGDGFCDDRARSAGCGTPSSGRRLAGFKAGHPVTVWLITNTSSGAEGWGTGECDGPAATGTVTLITELAVKVKK